MHIEIDDDLAEAIEQRMRLDESHQQVVRRLLLLGLKAGGELHPAPNRPGPGGPTRGVTTVKLSGLIRAGLVAAGDELRFTELRRGVLHVGRLDSEGRIRTDLGTYASPSSALGDLVGYSVNGWKAWVHVPSGETLSALRDGLGS